MKNLAKSLAVMIVSVLISVGSYSGAGELSAEKFAFVEELKSKIGVFPTVFAPNIVNKPMREFLIKQDLKWAKDVLEIGSGTGILSLITLKQGAGHIVATDINPSAVKNTLYNAELLGFGKSLDARLVSKKDSKAFARIGKDEKFDLIISNLPWYEREPKNIAEYAVFDENYHLLISFLDRLPLYLKENGRAWIEMGSANGNSIIKSKSLESGLKLKVLHEERNTYAIVEISKGNASSPVKN
jgi:methylase of polypeptide subunit release factors